MYMMQSIKGITEVLQGLIALVSVGAKTQKICSPDPRYHGCGMSTAGRQLTLVLGDTPL